MELFIIIIIITFFFFFFFIFFFKLSMWHGGPQWRSPTVLTTISFFEFS